MKISKVHAWRGTVTRSVLIVGCSLLISPQQAAAEDLIPKGWNVWDQGNVSVGFHGYLRTTLGVSGDGHTMTRFQAPGAQSAPRLGNEPDTNPEAALDLRYYMDGERGGNAPYLQLFGMVDDYEVADNYENIELEFIEERNPQLYANLGNLLGDGVNVWFGRRYYDRRDIHMGNHYWINTGQGAELGGGVEGIPVGSNTLDLAVFKAEDEKVSDLLGINTDVYNLNTYTYDARYRGIKTTDKGDLTLWGQYAERAEKDIINYDGKDGFAVGGWHTQPDMWGLGGRMVTGTAYRQGAAVVQGQFNAKAVREDQGYDLDDVYALEINNDLVIEPSGEDYSMQWSTILRRDDFGQRGADGKTIDWASTGVRPIFYITEHVHLATEVSVDYIDNKIIDASGFLGKGTVALELANGRGYFNRPVVRFFVTGAAWSDGLEGLVGNGNPPDATSFADETTGTTIGIQFEMWW